MPVSYIYINLIFNDGTKNLQLKITVKIVTNQRLIASINWWKFSVHVERTSCTFYRQVAICRFTSSEHQLHVLKTDDYI